MSAGPVRRTLARLAGALGAVGTAIILIVFGPLLADLPTGIGDVPHWFADAPERGLVTIVAAIAWLCLLWLCLGVLLGVAAAIPGGVGRLSGALARLVLPRAMRRLVELGLGVTLAAGVTPVMAAVPAMATGPATPISASASAALPDLARAPAPGTALHTESALHTGITGITGTTGTTGTTAAGLPSAARVVQPGSWSEQPTALPSLDRQPTASPRVNVPGLGGSVPVVDLRPTAPSSGSPSTGSPATASPGTPAHSGPSAPRPGSTLPQSPEPAQSAAPVHAAPDPGTPVRLTAARVPANWPDLTRPSTPPPDPTGPSTAPTGPAPAGGASTSAGSGSAASVRPPTPRPSVPSTSTPSTPSTPSRDPVVPPAHHGTGTSAAGTESDGEGVVVLRGDTLWTIAARHLGPTATHEQIAAEWPRWWAANADLIGHDPNLILPGQRLIPPSGP